MIWHRGAHSSTPLGGTPLGGTPLRARGGTPLRDRARRWARLALGVALLGTALPLAGLAIAVALEPLPEALRRPPPSSLRIEDRHGRLLGEVRAHDGAFSAAVTLDDVSPALLSALVAAEDRRFYSHPGVDPLALSRALGQLVRRGRVVSGGSTLTQQLARQCFDRPRTLAGKVRELVVALRIERELDKRQILEAYLSRVDFGPGLRGVEAASAHTFDKPALRLSLAEAATLAALPRGPSLYDPRRHPARLLARRDAILQRMLEGELAAPEAIERARREPLAVRAPQPGGHAPHLRRALGLGLLERVPGRQTTPARIVSTLDLALQREVEELARSTVQRVSANDASAVSVIVLDNPSGEVLAYVGSPRFDDDAALGQNDGVRARRQPGSTLKPFVYLAGMEALGLHAASLLPDQELHLPTPQGDYSPRNYDGRFHGPVRLRDALAASLNVPAVYVAQRSGPARLLALLHQLGFASLGDTAEHYGAALALGDGEVTLAELASAYATLARGGLYRPARFARGLFGARGEPLARPAAPARRVVDEARAALLTDILADDVARVAGFGRASAIDLEFPAAVKTGTSKGYRDNWAVGYTREVTVAVWVGNFDGHPMRQSSGVTGAGPLFAAALRAAMRGRDHGPLFARDLLVERQICAESGALAGPRCPHRLTERFTPLRLPLARCPQHAGPDAPPPARDLADDECRRHRRTLTPRRLARQPPSGSTLDPLPRRRRALRA